MFWFSAHSVLHLMYSEIAWVLVFLGTQVQPKIILDPNYFPDYLSVSYDYGITIYYNVTQISSFIYAFKVNESHIKKYIEKK